MSDEEWQVTERACEVKVTEELVPPNKGALFFDTLLCVSVLRIL